MNDEAHQITIGGDSLKTHTDHRKTETKKGGGHENGAQNSFSHQGTLNFTKTGGAARGSNGGAGGHRSSTKKHVKLNNGGGHHTSSKKNKHNNNSDHANGNQHSAQKPKQMQFEYGEGMADLINGLGLHGAASLSQS